MPCSGHIAERPPSITSSAPAAKQAASKSRVGSFDAAIFGAAIFDAGIFGAAIVVEAALGLEQAARAQREADARARLAELIPELDRLASQLRREYKPGNSP